MKKLSLVIIGLGFLAGIYAFSNKAVAENCEQVSWGSVCYEEMPAYEDTRDYPHADAPARQTTPTPVEEPAVEPAPTCQ